MQYNIGFHLHCVLGLQECCSLYLVLIHLSLVLVKGVSYFVTSFINRVVHTRENMHTYVSLCVYVARKDIGCLLI